MGYAMTDSRVEQLVWTTHAESTAEAEAEYSGNATPAQIWELTAYKLAAHYIALSANMSELKPEIHSGITDGHTPTDETKH